MSLRFAAFDPGWKQTRELALDSRVCDCCPTTAALTDDGPIVAFRNRSDEEVRDIYVARYEQGRWTEPTAVYHDDWKIQACPVNGPMLSARGRQVAIAWFTMKEDQGHAFVTFSDDAGRTFGTPIRVDERAALGRVDVELLGDGSAVASWLEFADQQTTFRLRRVERSGATSPVVTVAALASSRASGYPRIAVHNQDLLLAWTEAGQLATRVKTASIRLNVPASAPTSRH